ncbi:Vacuolar iron transporter-like protein 2 [Hibiscus syriacus]|uniref:Vacuolar iron transporter n=1 Tax=Hibiscus syriacus TaxID=106335 RepID=A0A6A3BHF7_HIBSY|nr:vacuolar iron transporter homolog 2-like [Hibiscus syriacus]XP_039070199.1 vacuolar iron transporter homolog 2-like [Hibiscus syriacus]KAE8670968.1 Vacuolar iron transporter-like protein 2 [Hibiscus syriacus]KAE8715301.1 Vacuolar iron transporter-like protein 2 [Hibiscus syriacus]
METTTNGTSFSNKKFTIPAVSDVEHQQASMELEPTNDVNYSKRSQWLRAAVLGANDGLVSTASLMMGVGAVKQDIKAMILTGFAGLVAGACSMAIGEFVSVYSQLDIELAQMKRDKQRDENRETSDEEEEKGKEGEKESLPNPLQASAASALAFSVGAMVPLLAASFIKEYKVRVGAVIGAVSLALLVFGWLGAVLGKAPTVRSAVRVLVGGWLAMAITFGLTKLIGLSGL